MARSLAGPRHTALVVAHPLARHGRVVSSHELLRIGLLRILAAGWLCLITVIRWPAEHGEQEDGGRSNETVIADEDRQNCTSGPSHEEARMLTPASVARTFSEFRASTIAAAPDGCSRTPRAKPLEALERVSYFDTLMRLRSRRPAPRRALHRI